MNALPLYQQILIATSLVVLLIFTAQWLRNLRGLNNTRKNLINTCTQILAGMKNCSDNEIEIYLKNTEILLKILYWLQCLANIAIIFPETKKQCDDIAPKWINIFLKICLKVKLIYKGNSQKFEKSFLEAYKTSGVKLAKRFWIDKVSLRIIYIGNLIYSVMDSYRLFDSDYYSEKNKMKFDNKILPKLCLEIFQLVPEDGGNRVNRANLYSEIHYVFSSLNKFDEASYYITKAIDLFPENPKFYTNRVVLNEKKIEENGCRLSNKEKRKLEKKMKADILIALRYGPYSSALALAKEQNIPYSTQKHKIGVIIRVLQKMFEGSVIEEFYKITASYIAFECLLVIGLLLFAIFDFKNSWSQRHFSSITLLITGIVGLLFWVYFKKASKAEVLDRSKKMPLSYNSLKRSVIFSMLESLSLSVFALSYCFWGVRVGELLSIGQLFSIADILYNSCLRISFVAILLFHFKKIFTYKW